MVLESYYDAQVSVLGCLIIDPNRLAGEIFQRVTESDFRDATLHNLFAAAKTVWNSDTPLDPVTLLNAAGNGYDQVIRQIMDATPTCAHWETYCEILRESSQLSQMRDLADKILDCSDIESARKLLAKAEGLVMDRPMYKITSYTDMIGGFLGRQQSKKAPDYLDWGMPELNEALSISPGRFVILAADSSVGKTAFALQLARNMAASGKRVGFFSYETSQADAADRVIANFADVRLPKIKRRRLESEDIKRVMQEGRRSDNLDWDLIECAGATVDDIRAITLMRRYDIILIDYVQLIPDKGEARWQQVSNVSMDLHTLSQQLGVTVIGLSQVTPSKTSTGERKALSRENLRESRQLILDAEAILIMDLTDPKDFLSPRYLKIDKNKDGPCGTMLLRFDPQHMRFSYQPPFKDGAQQKADELNAKKDANRKARQEKEAGKPMTGQQRFEELPDDYGGELPL